MSPLGIRRLLVPLAALAVALGPAPAASARTTYCSPSGDLCYGAFDMGAKVNLRITLMAGYFKRYRLCVTAPDGTRRCHGFRMHRIEHGMYDSTIRWSRHFPNRGAGTYHARWSYAGGNLGPRISFAAGPTIRTRPSRVSAGGRIRVFGLAGGCRQGNQVTLMSEAFPDDNEFAGVPAIFATVDAHDSYSVSTPVPATTPPGRYVISARCGGGNFGVQGAITVNASQLGTTYVTAFGYARGTFEHRPRLLL
jgi:hypothetical protein